MPTPVFTLGSPRNGTTWLSNLVGSHPAVSAIRHEAHWGTHENKLYANWSFWNDFQSTDDFIQFAEVYASADYFRISAVESPYFADEPPGDFLEFYLDLMDKHARCNGTPYWTTKLDSLLYSHPGLLRTFLNVVTSRYDNIRFVAVKRELEAVLRSYVHMQGRSRQNRGRAGIREAAMALQTARHVFHYSVVNTILADHGGLLLQFADLQEHRADATAQICDYLDLDWTDSLLEDEFPPNSSFRGRSRARSIPQWELQMCHRLLRPIFSTFPSLAYLLLRLRALLRSGTGPTLYWRLLKLDRMPERFREELRNAGNVGLLDVLFSTSRE